jgi:LmbE family N-acetylglucosaminyl deacetylase
VIEVTARGLPADHWRPRLAAAAEPALPAGGFASIVVAVPHPDDETLGAGGLLHRLVHAPARPQVRVVFVTDGAAGYPGVDPGSAAHLAAERRREALAALGELGLGDADAVFLDRPDGGLTEPVEADLTRRLEAVLAERRADLCLAPWPLDPHPDHQAVGRAARAASAVHRTPLWQYPIWMRHSVPAAELGADEPRLRVLRLTEAEKAAKEAALRTHASQLRSPFPDYGPVLPEHVVDLFADGLEPFFVPAPE